MIRLFVIEDHSLIVDGLRNRFRLSRDGIEISGSASSVTETIELAAQIEFDIIFLDLWLPGSERSTMFENSEKPFRTNPSLCSRTKLLPSGKCK